LSVPDIWAPLPPLSEEVVVPAEVVLPELVFSLDALHALRPSATERLRVPSSAALDRGVRFT
jgi:hypothetical protein